MLLLWLLILCLFILVLLIPHTVLFKECWQKVFLHWTIFWLIHNNTHPPAYCHYCQLVASHTQTVSLSVFRLVGDVGFFANCSFWLYRRCCCGFDLCLFILLLFIPVLFKECWQKVFSIARFSDWSITTRFLLPVSIINLSSRTRRR